jgi:hypothetical protein
MILTISRTARNIAAFLVVMVSLTANGYYSPSWLRVLVDNSFFEVPGDSFAVSSLTFDDNSLSAICWYRYRLGTDTVILHGTRGDDSTFRPNVTYEVATADKTKWKAISADPQEGGEKITISPDKPEVKLRVNMEPFRKTVGVFRYGRLVLENGDAAIFAIEDLLPTADARGDTDDFKEIIFQSDEDKRKRGYVDTWIGGPAAFVSVISVGDRLIGEFVFAASSKAAVLEGTRTSDGDFWPKGTFQVGNHDKDWKTIGKSQHGGKSESLEIPSGKSERVRFVMSSYKPLTAKFKYGKIVFSNGQAVVFSMDLLNPK